LAKLREHGIESVEQLAQMTPEDLMQIQGVGEKTVDRIRRIVTDYFERDASGGSAASEGGEAPVEVLEGEAEEAAETSETSGSEGVPPSSPEEGPAQEPADVVEAAENEKVEEHSPPEGNNSSESSDPDESGHAPAGTGGEEK
jgi:N utilization substance protein A